MYRALVVDDEKMIRMGIKKAIPWEKIGVSEVFAAASGKEALQIIEAQKPQIMVTDIQMTEMTGLELIQRARELMPEIRIIVLTGYDNFEYARQSLRLAVQDFFLKPIDEVDLANAIRKQVQHLEEQQIEEKNQQMLWRVQGTAQQVKLEGCVRDLVHDKKNRQELLAVLRDEFGFTDKNQMGLILIDPVLYMNQSPGDENFRAMSVKSVCMGMVDARELGITFYDDDGVIGVVCFEQREGESILDLVEQLSNILKDEFDSKPKIMVGSTVSGFENLVISYNDARYLLENEKENIRDIVQTFRAQNKTDIMNDLLAELKGTMCANVGNTSYVMKVYDTYTKAMESYNVSALVVRRSCFEIAAALYYAYVEDSGEIAEGKLDALTRSLATANRDEACEVTRMFISQLIRKEEENVSHIIAQAKHYIEDHLMDDLSVSSIASNLYITPNYFSRLFKREMKEGCNEYIVRKRIEKAKSLLETTSMRVSRIAAMVGYRDTNYFSLAFKKHTGESPTKYREKMQQ